MKLAQIAFVALTSSFLAIACSANTESADPETDPAASGDEQDLVAKAYSSCTHDSDCEAIEKPVCCPDGTKVAVNKHKADDYVKAKHPAVCNMMCPRHEVLDTKVALCDISKNQCKMYNPEEVRCGGFSPNPHGCAEGYQCTFPKHMVPDMPGTCTVKPDCRSTGCGTGKWCSACWGHFACIPKGAMC